MMNANDVIEAHVAVRLPRRQRNDAAFELRALLHEELRARAEADEDHRRVHADQTRHRMISKGQAGSALIRD
jgi:hypothetical protein